MNKQWATIAISTILLFGTFALAGREQILQAFGDFLVVESELHPADIIHVVSGPDHRTDYAIQLFAEGLGSQLFFTGSWCPDIQGIHAEHGRERAMEQGVPDEDIAIDGSTVTSTYSEALRLREFIEAQPTPIKSVIIVSDPHHMRRTQWAYRRVLSNDIELLMAPVSFDMTPYERRWWLHEQSKEMVTEEYLKSLYYIARYQLSRGELKEWLASLDTT